MSVRWLIVGAGAAGRCHIEAIARTTGASLIGIVDPGEVASKVPLYRHLAAALKSEMPDAVIIATPNDTQVVLAAQALAAGLPVLCEKPVGVSVAEAERLIAMAADEGVAAGVVLNQRAQVHCRWIKDLIQSGALSPQSISFTGDVTRLMGWHRDPIRSGGGALRTIGIHFLDLLLWWLGPMQEIDAKLSGPPRAEEGFDVRLSFANGGNARVQIDAVKEQGTGPVRCVIEGAGRGQRLEMTGHAITQVSGLPDPPTAETYDPALFFGPGHEAVIAEATASLASGQGFPVPLTEALPVLRLIEGVYARETTGAD